MKTLGILAIVALALIGFWLFWANQGVITAAWWLGSTKDEAIQRAGQWADTFGAFNALVSTIGSAAILATLWLQARSLTEQSTDLYKQRFESRFFELLKLVREVRAEIVFTHSSEYVDARIDPSTAVFTTRLRREVSEPTKGHDAIRAAVTEFRYWIAPGRLPRSKTTMVKVYEDRIHKHNEASFGPYFRLVYTVLRRISGDTVLSASEKVQYGNLLRSQLTSEELTLLAVNGMAPFSADLANFIKEFRLLKYLPQSSVQRRFVVFYGSTTFASRD